jgi:3-phenylpropionate/trans-cinnamate dioxygenase ferredoxin reductase subunit
MTKILTKGLRTRKHLFTGALWVGLYLFLSLLPILLVSVGPKPPGRDFLTELSVGLAFMALAMMCLQFAITARFQWLKEPFGSDIVYGFHRAISLVAVLFVVLHPLLLALTPVRPKVLIRLDFINHPLYPRWGFYAALALAALVTTSLWRSRLGISYETWRRAHAIFAVGLVIMGVFHVAVENHYFGMPLKVGLWISYTMLWTGVIVWVRLFKPWRELHRPFVVESVREELGNARTLTLAPSGHQGFRFAPGQFAWLTLFTSPFSDREHPFSFSSSAEATPRLEFTIKELGDFTQRIKEVKPGDRAYVDGPFGAITADRHPYATGFVFVAGGIGITPMMSHLRTFADRGERRPLVLIYANNKWEDITFRDEIESLAPKLILNVVHVLTKPPEGWQGERGYVTEDLLRRHAPSPNKGYEYLICGPTPMMKAVENALSRIGVHAGDIHAERFNLV